MPLVRATVNLKEPAHYMNDEGLVLFTIYPNEDGRGILIDFDSEDVVVQISGKRPVTNPMGLTIQLKDS